MEPATPVETRRPVRITALQRLMDQSSEFFSGLTRMTLLAAILTPVLLVAFLTIDLPVRVFDGAAGGDFAVRPSNWLTRGGLVMALAPLLAILFSRRFGGDEASRAITASWGVAALAVFAELSYLAPALEPQDFPGARFTMVFVASAMAGQYIAVNVYDVARGGGQWWRAPLYGALSGYFVHVLIYFPVAFWGQGAPWLNWMVGDFAIKAMLAFAFLPVYGLLRRKLRPRGGFGGR